MANKLAGGWEPFGDTWKVYAIIPLGPNGTVNDGIFKAALKALTDINPDAFDAFDPYDALEKFLIAEKLAQKDGHTADGGGVIPHGVAEAMMRDGVPPDDDEGDIVPDPRACPAGGGCDD